MAKAGRAGHGGHGAAGPARAGEGRGEGKEGVGCCGPKGGAQVAFPFSISFFFFLAQICICLNDFKFKFECMSVQKCTTISSTSQAIIHTQSFTHEFLCSYVNLFVKII